MQSSALNKRAILIICRGLNEIPLLSQIKPEPEYRYVIASDDIRVQELVKQYPWVDDECWIEQMESFYGVASDVITILEGVNGWLKSLTNDRFGMPTDLLFWIRHAEGGMTTQRIQDALLLIRSYLYLLDTYNVDGIILLRGSKPFWEDEVLIQTARSRGIRIQEIGFFDRNTGLKYRIKGLRQRVNTYFKYALRIPHHVYRIYKIIQVKYRQHSRCTEGKHIMPTSSQDEIIFQLCSSGDNHVENIVPLMKVLQQKGYKPVALTWGATQGAEKIHQEGLYAEELEHFIPERSFLEAPYRVFHTWLKANRRIKKFCNLSELKYQSVPLGPLLWPSVHYFINSELAMMYKLDQALKVYFKQHDPVAIRLWGGGVLSQGFIAWRNLNRIRKPLIFLNWIGVGVDWPYWTKEDPTDLFLAVGRIQKEQLESHGFPVDRIVMVGQQRYSFLMDWIETHSPDISRSYLNIPSEHNIYIFYDPNAVLRGLLSTQEQALITNTLLNIAKENPSAALIIKPHPVHRPGMLEQMIEHYSLPNVFLIDKSMLPYHALNAANLVITKFSTIGIEGMLFGRPIISAILDREERWQFVFRDAAEYVETVGALKELLEKLVRDPEFRFQWTENSLEKQKQFLKQYFADPSKHSALLAADAIVSHLKGSYPNALSLRT